MAAISRAVSSCSSRAIRLFSGSRDLSRPAARLRNRRFSLSISFRSLATALRTSWVRDAGNQRPERCAGQQRAAGWCIPIDADADSLLNSRAVRICATPAVLIAGAGPNPNALVLLTKDTAFSPTIRESPSPMRGECPSIGRCSIIGQQPPGVPRFVT
jgi:hypothetical protein